MPPSCSHLAPPGSGAAGKADSPCPPLGQPLHQRPFQPIFPPPPKSKCPSGRRGQRGGSQATKVGGGVTLPKHPPPSWGPLSRLLPGRPSQDLGSRPQVVGPTAEGPSHPIAWPSSACSGFRPRSPLPTPAQPPLTGFLPRSLQPTVSPGPLMTGAREHGWLILVPALLPRGGPWH